MAEDDSTTPVEKKDEVLGEGGLRALQAERDANKELRARLQQLEKDAEARENEKLSKEEQLAKRAEAAEARATELESAEALRKLRDEVAEETGIPAKLLSGSDKESLTASAAGLKEFLEESSGPRQPAPNPYAGHDSGEGSDQETEARAVLGF